MGLAREGKGHNLAIVHFGTRCPVVKFIVTSFINYRMLRTAFVYSTFFFGNNSYMSDSKNKAQALIKEGSEALYDKKYSVSIEKLGEACQLL